MAFFKNKAENDIPTSHDIDISINGVKIKVALKVDQEEISKRINRSNDEGSCERNPNSDEIKIKVDGFLNNYGGSIPRNVFDDMQDAQLGSFKNFLVLKSDFEKIVEDQEAYRAFNEKLIQTSENNNRGKELEKIGEFEEALSVYEKNLGLGYHATHSFERLIILYRKLRRYTDELRIIDLYLHMIKERESKRRNLMNVNSICRSSSPDIIRLEKRRATVLIKIEGSAI